MTINEKKQLTNYIKGKLTEKEYSYLCKNLEGKKFVYLGESNTLTLVNDNFKVIVLVNKKQIEEGLSDKELLHAKIIRDADKLDNYRVKQEERIENIFPGVVNNKEEMENSLISDNVYNSVMKEECVDIKDRKYPLDYWICVLAFTFDLYFKETLLIVKEKNYIDILIDRFNYNNSKEEMNKIRNVLNDYVEKKLNN